MATATVRRRRLGIALKQLRGEASLDSIGKAIGMSQSNLSRLERGQIAARSMVLKSLLDHYNVHGNERKRLMDLAKEQGQSGWWRAYAGVIPERHLDHIALESEADKISTWEPVLIPALLQTEEYARAMFSSGGFQAMSATEIDQRVHARLARQDRITGEDPAVLTAIFDETALTRPVGPPAVMKAQLERVLELSERPNVTVQIIPVTAGAHAGIGGSVTILDYEEDQAELSVAFLETIGGDMYLDEPKDLRVCRSTFDMLRSVALGPIESQQKVAQLTGGSELG
ncbi:helix-turn-helix transcriptional regulator [Phytomonospora sp. NPDC050363]|uniref:helix-turn-helix domain-containing protein n=1 Tax=Phytomonospora sp. NPDC050363 TaxID=3155642 RepID=UPI0034043F82